MPKRLLRQWGGPVAVLFGLFMIFWNAPAYFANTSLIFQFMVYIVLAQGINLLYGFTGYLPFGYVGFFGIGAYAAGLAIQNGHLPGGLALIIGGLAAALVGLLLAPLLRLSGAYFAIGSLAASQVIYFLVSNPSMTPITNGPYGLALTASYHPLAAYLAMMAIMLVFTAGVIIIKKSHWGLVLHAIKDDPVSARSAGIPIVWARTAIWVVACVAAGLAGAAYGWHTSVFYPSTVFDLNISVFAIVFTLFGGGGTVLGPLLGVAVLFGLYNYIGISTPQYFQLVYGVIIMVMVLFLPSGLVSLIRRKGIHVL